jgi:hypothetical protein
MGNQKEKTWKQIRSLQRIIHHGQTRKGSYNNQWCLQVTSLAIFLPDVLRLPNDGDNTQHQPHQEEELVVMIHSKLNSTTCYSTQTDVLAYEI